MSVDILSEEDVERIALSKMCEYIDSDEWCEDGSVRMDIKVLQKQVKALQKQAHIMTGVVTTMADIIEILERKI
jgi:hypothetical protein